MSRPAAADEHRTLPDYRRADQPEMASSGVEQPFASGFKNFLRSARIVLFIRIIAGSKFVANAPHGANQFNLYALINLFTQIIYINVHDVRHGIGRELPYMLNNH